MLRKFSPALFLFLALIIGTLPAVSKEPEENGPPLQSITGKLTLVENHLLSTTIQVKKVGRKGGLRSVRAIVNSKTLIQYPGKEILLKDIPLQSTVRLEYERVKGVIVARSILVKKLYVKPAPKAGSAKK
jgi:hypothetical protein